LIQNSIYKIPLKSIDNTVIDLNEYRDKYLLIVNVASYCGFTSQYKDLQKLYEQFENLEIIALPCNQFLFQEPFGAKKIKQFCKKNYGITFQISEKIHVKGKNQHKIYRWLTSSELNGVKDSAVLWNFNKYLIGLNGELIEHFSSKTNPLSIKITQHLK
jgi:glutathione peroxidase